MPSAGRWAAGTDAHVGSGRHACNMARTGEGDRLVPHGADGDTRDVTTVVYYDLTSPECFVLHEALGALTDSSGLTGTEWRGVQVDPSLPVPMRPLDRRAIERLRIDAADAARTVPGVRIDVPPGMPNTRAALQAIATVERQHGPRAWRMREELFRAIWWHGLDVSQAPIIRDAAAAAGVPPWLDLGDAAAQAAQVGWELAWRTERLGGVPRAVRADGQILWKAPDREGIRAFFSL